MSDEPEPTEQEREEAEALAKWLDGQPSPGLSARKEETAAFLQHTLHPRTNERIASVKKRLNLRRRPRWGVRAAYAAVAMAAAVLLVVWMQGSPTQPTEVLQIAKKGDPQAIELAMQAYRHDQPELKRAAAVHAKADAAIASGDLETARAAVTTLTSGEGPVARDAWFRLATIELRAGRNDVALQDAERGLAMGRAEDLYTLNLLLARAAAHKARGETDQASEDLFAALTLVETLTNAAIK